MFSFLNKKTSVFESGLLGTIRDRHSHILYGVDDGVPSSAMSLDILAMLGEHGLGELWLTPHVMEDLPNGSDALKRRFAELCGLYDGPVKLHLAAEYMMDTRFDECLEARDLLVMDDGHLLVETSTWSPPYDLHGILDRILRAGYRPLLAHPERYRYMKESDYAMLVESGVHLQLNLPSLVGAYGEEAKGKAERILRSGWYTAVGSDCHNISSLQRAYSRKVLSSKTVDLLSRIDV